MGLTTGKGRGLDIRDDGQDHRPVRDSRRRLAAVGVTRAGRTDDAGRREVVGRLDGFRRRFPIEEIARGHPSPGSSRSEAGFTKADARVGGPHDSAP
ncbi:MAG: hypothetical protein JWQ90_2552 [Hydrocarboniphaga sp.]|nr:hypothetical protein [Hydrocarboniphaga sp.]